MLPAINLVAGDHTIGYVLEHSEARLILADRASSAQIEAITRDLPQPPRILEISEEALAPHGAPVSTRRPDSESHGLLMYTSGTTGKPKGVLLSHRNLLAGGQNTVDAHQLTAKDRALCVLPLYHINGLCVTVLAPLLSGGSLVIPDKFSVSRFWKTIRDHRCSWFSVVPTQVSYLLHLDDTESDSVGGGEALRFGRSASAPLSPEMHTAFEKRFGVPVIETMGLTETAAQVLSNPLPPGRRKIGSPGMAFGNEVRIGGLDQQEVPRGQEGEVLVRGANVMQGYLKNEAATQDAITAEGWLRTGDLGRMDEDGYFFITGRLKELIIKGGENIAPREVDDALYSHPDVIEAAAFACECRHYGQRIEAGVVVCEGSDVSEGQLIELCRQKIGPFKAPDRVIFLADLPKGPSGKIQRIRLAELATKK